MAANQVSRLGVHSDDTENSRGQTVDVRSLQRETVSRRTGPGLQRAAAIELTGYPSQYRHITILHDGQYGTVARQDHPGDDALNETIQLAHERPGAVTLVCTDVSISVLASDSLESLKTKLSHARNRPDPNKYAHIENIRIENGGLHADGISGSGDWQSIIDAIVLASKERRPVLLHLVDDSPPYAVTRYSLPYAVTRYSTVDGVLRDIAVGRLAMQNARNEEMMCAFDRDFF